jgi:hypothetical protein
MVRIKKLSAGLISALALSAIIAVGGGAIPTATAAERSVLPYCTASKYVTYKQVVWVEGLGSVVPGWHLPALSDGYRGCKNDQANQTAWDAVKVIQNAANSFYRQNLTRDGKYGPKTAKAVKYMQEFAGLKGYQADSVYGPVTCTKILWPVQQPRMSNGSIWWFKPSTCSW